MRLDGIHHVSCVTGEARRNRDFYTRVLGLRMVAKTVNQDDPFVYHLFYADDHGSPGADMTFFEFPGALPGRAGAGMIHRVGFRVPTVDALGFWADRLAAEGIAIARHDHAVHFTDPEGLGLELVARDDLADPPLRATHPEVPAAMAITGFDGVRAYGRRDGVRRVLDETMGGTATGDWTWEFRGSSRGGTIAYDAPPDLPSRPSAGCVHHVAWATEPAEHDAWLERLDAAGIANSGMVDRHYFRSIYFRDAVGVLHELATKGPGFTVDTPLERLGTALVLPPALEPRRAEIEARLTPLD